MLDDADEGYCVLDDKGDMGMGDSRFRTGTPSSPCGYPALSPPQLLDTDMGDLQPEKSLPGKYRGETCCPAVKEWGDHERFIPGDMGGLLP